MPERKLFAQAFGFVALATAAGLLVWNSRRVTAVKPLRGHRAEAVARLLIDTQDEEFDLRKRAGHWSLEAPIHAPADDEACDAAVAGLGQLELGAVVSRDPKSYPDYRVEESTAATRVRVYLENSAVPALDGYFGSLALGPNTAFFRGFRERDVRLAVGASRSLFDRPLYAWERKEDGRDEGVGQAAPK